MAARKVLYPPEYNPILLYWEQIKTGKEIVSQKIRKTYKKLAQDVRKPRGEWHYDPERANHILEFAENYCQLIQGKTGPVVLELWEKALLAAVFGFVDAEGNRKYREVILIIGKKNGKSLLASIVGLYMLLADGEPGPEVYAVATKRDQAKKIWLTAKQMLLKSPVLRKRARALVAEIDCDQNNGFFKPLASDVDTLDGLNVHCVLMDEIHQWKNGKALYDIMADGVTAREQPMIFITSTAGTIREDLYDIKYDEAKRIINGYEDKNGYRDERTLAFVYELDKREEWHNPKAWKKANPGLGTIKSHEQLAHKVKKAEENPHTVKNLVCKEFNIPETSSEAWLTWEELNNEKTFDVQELKPKYGIGGADLSSGVDLTAACTIFMCPEDEHIYVMHMYWIPEELVEQRVREDKIPYDLWIEQGWMRTCPGNKIDASCVTQWFLEVYNDMDICLPWVGYDDWSAMYWVKEMSESFGKNTMISVRQGVKTLSSPMKTMGADLRSGRLIYNNNPITKWCLANTSYTEDKNGNIQPCKTSKRTRRIDGMAAMLDAYVVLQEKAEEYKTLI